MMIERLGRVKNSPFTNGRNDQENRLLRTSEKSEEHLTLGRNQENGCRKHLAEIRCTLFPDRQRDRKLIDKTSDRNREHPVYNSIVESEFGWLSLQSTS